MNPVLGYVVGEELVDVFFAAVRETRFIHEVLCEGGNVRETFLARSADDKEAEMVIPAVLWRLVMGKSEGFEDKPSQGSASHRSLFGRVRSGCLGHAQGTRTHCWLSGDDFCEKAWYD